MTFRGVYTNGRVELEAGARLPEGTPVNVKPVRSNGTTGKSSKLPRKQSKRTAVDPAYRIYELAVHDGGPPDMADEHDHYIYGTPKRGARRTPASRRKRTPRTKR